MKSIKKQSRISLLCTKKSKNQKQLLFRAIGVDVDLSNIKNLDQQTHFSQPIKSMQKKIAENIKSGMKTQCEKENYVDPCLRLDRLLNAQYFPNSINLINFLSKSASIFILNALILQEMKQQPSRTALQARFKRRARNDGGIDEQQDDDEDNFKDNLENALKKHGRRMQTNDIEEQIEYFGYKMEPFNMREEEDLGQIDKEGNYIYGNKRRRGGDAWLNSLDDNEELNIEALKKKIKLQQREKTVLDADRKIQERNQSGNQEQSIKEEDEDQDIDVEQDQDRLNPNEIKLLLSQLLPFSTSANQYLKKLKKSKETQLYDKVLYMCNEYITLTSDHSILTMKKEQLQEEDEEEDKPIQNWDEDGKSQNENKKHQNQQQDNDDDNIF